MVDINKKLFIFVMSIVILMVIMIVIFISNKSFAFDEENNYMSDYILNHDWVEYMELSDEEKSLFEIVPEKFIYQHKKNKISYFNLRNNYPNYYNLNDYGLSTFPEAQGSLGLCWAFASLSSVETNMLKIGLTDINNYKNLSERQLDYALVNSSYISEGYNPYSLSTRYYPGSGAYPNSSFVLMGTGVSPVTVEKFGEYDTSQDVKSLKDVFNLDDVEYVVDEYVNYGSIKDYSSADERKSWVNSIKNHVMNYGSVAITTIGTLASYGGSCLYKDTSNNYLINVRGECNPLDTNNIHAMAVIGWDDDYEYEYCRLDDETTSDLTNCTNIVSGKGAFILKNSWGDIYPYPYFSYESNVDGAYGVTKVSKKDWDINYDFTKSSESSYGYGLSTITYHKSSQISEKLEKISFYSNGRNLTSYDIYISSNDSNNYVKVDSIDTDNIGLYTIYIDDIVLDSDVFKIKIESDNGYVDQIYAFTSYIDKSDDIVIDTVIKSGLEYGKNIDEFSVYSVTRNVDSGGLIEYRLVDGNNNDISNLFSIKNNYSLNNEVIPKIEINGTFPIGDLIFQTIYNGVLYDSEMITINNIKNLWSGGSGTVDDPFLIDSAVDFVKIFTGDDYLSAHYRLINDLDFSEIETWNAGYISNYKSFRGSLDGNNHSISGLKGDSNLPFLFYSLDMATIKNLIFENISFDIEESGWGNLVSMLAYDSYFENIVITKSVEIKGKASNAGGIVATAYNSKFKNIFNYADVSTEYAFYGKAAGIVVEAYGCEIIESYNYGNIIAMESIVGGIVAYLDSDIVSSSVGKIENVYNVGKIKSNLYGGGIAGYAKNSIIKNVYNRISVGNNIGNIVGTVYNMYIKDSYYLDMGDAIITDEENRSSLVNVIGKTDSQLKDKGSYLNYDFDNIWDMNKSYPYLKNISYYYLDYLIIDERIELEVGSTKKLEIFYEPINCNIRELEFKVEDNGIISIDDEENINALKEGNTTLNINTLDGSGITKKIDIMVTKLDKINLDKYDVIDNKYIIVDGNTIKNDFISSIYNGNKLEIKLNSKNEFIATGDKLEILDQLGKKMDEYSIIVLGDVDGDGILSLFDIMKVANYIYINNNILSDVYLYASDYNKDKNYDLKDIMKIAYDLYG